MNIHKQLIMVMKLERLQSNKENEVSILVSNMVAVWNIIKKFTEFCLRGRNLNTLNLYGNRILKCLKI